jgi:hypothetical protein
MLQAAFAVIFSIKCFVMKYYLVASTTCALVGIEQCVVFVVGPSRQAAFERQYQGRILMVSTCRQALPPVPGRVYH